MVDNTFGWKIEIHDGWIIEVPETLKGHEKIMYMKRAVTLNERAEKDIIEQIESLKERLKNLQELKK